jgi:large subunit ribosomal protein L13
MDFNRIHFFKKSDKKPVWHLIDAQGKVVGRLATEIANKLRGKDKAWFTPHADGGDYVVVINADKVVLTGDKMEDKIYDRHTGWLGHYKTLRAKEILKKDPTKILKLAVRGMLPKNKLNRAIFGKLKVYAGSEHPHGAQVGQ